MQFSALPESTHPLVTLRPIEAADLPVWFDYLSMPAVFEHTSWNVSTVDDLAHYAWTPASRLPSTMLRFAVARRADDALVGTAGFHSVVPQNRSAELAYDLSPVVWGQGVASHIVTVLTAWAHADVGMTRVQATVLDSNARSARVLERCGFEREGLLRSYRMVRGRPGDFFMYSHIESAIMQPDAAA